MSPNGYVDDPPAADGPTAPKQRLDAGEELHHVERLHQVVVRAELETHHAVDDLAPCGQHQHRDGLPARAEVAHTS